MDVCGTIEVILGQKPRAVWSVSPEATVYEAIAMMAEKNVGALLVMEEGKLVGIVSERDYSRKVMLKGKTSRNSHVHEIMTTELTTAHPRETVEDCLRFMTEKRIRHLPVVADGELRGVISIGDLVKQVISAQSATLDQLKDYIAGGYPS
ncbi:MAG: CBS domain-containing protein [Chthoniobacterales bacterium]|nr:CBS domain-containing protein [Chthoniobacterales bacterium]